MKKEADMIRKSHKQSSFMDADYICERLVPQDSFCRKFKDTKHPVWGLTPNRAFRNTLTRGVYGALLAPIQQLNYSYDSVGNITACANNMFISMDGNTETVRRTFVYDGFYRLVTSTGEQDWAPNTQTPQIMQNYGVSTSYDNVHNITNKTQYVNTYSPPGGAPVPYAAKTYNNGYSYMILGSTKPHAPISIGSTTYTYDPDGNMTNYVNGDLSRTISWDAENRVRSVSDTAGGEVPQNILTEKYWYNDAGQRVIKRTLNDSPGETEYLNQFVSISRSDAQLNGYIMTKNYYLGNEREASSVAPVDYGGLTETTYFYHTDHLGSSTYLMDSNGNIAEHIEYTPWGEMWNEQAMAGVTTTGVPNYFFTSKELDLTQLYYFGARYYDPQTSVWMSPDQALPKYLPSTNFESDFRLKRQPEWKYIINLPSEGGVFNSLNLALFTYAGNSPIRYLDPDGQIRAECYDNYIQIGGSYNWRTNNPGMMEYTGQNGELRASEWDEGRFAVFASEEEGMNALKNNLSENYSNLSVQQLANKYAPKTKKDPTNDPKKYAEDLIKFGVNKNKPVGEQIDKVAEAIKMREGWREGAIQENPSGDPNETHRSMNTEGYRQDVESNIKSNYKH
jgi:RHS repeat-associated protein